MRRWVVSLHRWFGLASALFLLLTAVTGIVLVWQHELDVLLNPELYRVEQRGEGMDPRELVRRIEAAHPDVRVSYVPLAVVPGESLAFGVEPRSDAAPGFNEVFMNPITGDELGTREWGKVWPLQRDNLLPFVYVLHESLHLPGNWGTLLLGVVASFWVLDCFAGLYLTLPRRSGLSSSEQSAPTTATSTWWQRWQSAWCIRDSGFRRWFDLHRAGGLWLWGLLLVYALSSVALSLYDQVFHPALSAVTTLTPSPYDLREPGPQYRSREPVASFNEILDSARREGQRLGLTLPPGDIFYARSYGFYRVKFFDEQHPRGDHPLGEAMLFFDGSDGTLVGSVLPGVGTVGDFVIQAQFPLHAGHLFGAARPWLIVLTGLMVCTLTITGLVIWWRKSKARRARWSRPARQAQY